VTPKYDDLCFLGQLPAVNQTNLWTSTNCAKPKFICNKRRRHTPLTFGSFSDGKYFNRFVKITGFRINAEPNDPINLSPFFSFR
jgi:hypothetical protein